MSNYVGIIVNGSGAVLKNGPLKDQIEAKIGRTVTLAPINHDDGTWSTWYEMTVDGVTDSQGLKNIVLALEYEMSIMLRTDTGEVVPATPPKEKHGLGAIIDRPAPRLDL